MHSARWMFFRSCWRSPDVTEIMVNGMNRDLSGEGWNAQPMGEEFLLRRTDTGRDRQITGACNRAVNESQPIVDARLENGDRVHVVLAAGGGQRTDHHDTTISKRADDHETAAGDGQYLSGGD